MRNLCVLFALLCMTLLCGCGSVRFNESSSEVATASATTDSSQASSGEQELDCDQYMQSFADSCFDVTVKDENGMLRNDVDANGNDLGPVDQAWAADYCTCFAQRAFQEYGCAAVYADEELVDEAWQNKYNAIGDACAEAVQNLNMHVDSAEAPATDSAEAPAADSAEAPAAGSVEAPAVGSAEVPAAGSVEAPAADSAAPATAETPSAGVL